MTTRAGVGTSRHHSPGIAGHDTAERALENAGASKPDLIFMCAAVGSDVPWAGFYTSREISPAGGHNCYHNHTSIVLALGGRQEGGENT